MDKRTSIPANALIWFGAGVSLAEILTGTFFAPLGFRDGGIAIVVGHIIGCFLLFLAGLIGARTHRSAMETVKMAFGARGGLLFAVLNVMQLIGWTSIMIYDGALAANSVMDAGHWLWCFVIGVLIIVWIRIGILRIERVNAVAMTGLFLLTVLLCSVIMGGTGAAGSAAGETMSFAMALELSIAMPLSWLPLISDYTREAEKPVAAAAVSALVYGLVSCWMYFIGMGGRRSSRARVTSHRSCCTQALARQGSALSSSPPSPRRISMRTRRVSQARASCAPSQGAPSASA